MPVVSPERLQNCKNPLKQGLSAEKGLYIEWSVEIIGPIPTNGPYYPIVSRAYDA